VDSLITDVQVVTNSAEPVDKRLSLIQIKRRWAQTGDSLLGVGSHGIQGVTHGDLETELVLLVSKRTDLLASLSLSEKYKQMLVSFVSGTIRLKDLPF